MGRAQRLRASAPARLVLAATVAVALSVPAAAPGGGGGFPWRDLPLCTGAAAAKLRVTTNLLPRALEFSARAPGSRALAVVVDSYDDRGERVARLGPVGVPDDVYGSRLANLGRRPARWVVSAAARIAFDGAQCRAGVVVIVTKSKRRVTKQAFRCARGAKGSSRVLRCNLRAS